MDEINQISKDSKEIVITDAQIEEVHPTLDSNVIPKKPLWEQDVDEEVERQKSGI